MPNKPEKSHQYPIYLIKLELRFYSHIGFRYFDYKIFINEFQITYEIRSEFVHR